MTWQDESADLICDFDDFINLSTVVCPSAINNKKNGLPLIPMNFGVKSSFEKNQFIVLMCWACCTFSLN
jgi:hypothetical protein